MVSMYFCFGIFYSIYCIVISTKKFSCALMNNIVGAVIKEILEISIMFTLYIDIFLKHKVDSAFHASEVDKMSTRNIWELSGKK